jgi:tRNA A37 N6-isopentenylltransferase MiaA
MANEIHLHPWVSILHPPSSILALIFLAGPTAAGKSAVALALAERIGGEIISVDSMQVYRGLDIGTAKPGPEELRRARHHLIDVAGLEEAFDAAQFVAAGGRGGGGNPVARAVPIFCGGTGIYFKAYREGLGDAPPADAALRAELEAQPLAELLAELEKSDPATFQRIDRQNPRRVIRAVEVIRLTGRPFSGAAGPMAERGRRGGGESFWFDAPGGRIAGAHRAARGGDVRKRPGGGNRIPAGRGLERNPTACRRWATGR